MNIHTRAKQIAKKHLRSEVEVIEILIELDQTQKFKELKHNSLFCYVVAEMEFTEHKTNYFINIARKAYKFPELRKSIRSGKITVSKAEKIASSLNKERAAEVVAYAEANSIRKTLKWLKGQGLEVKKDNIQLAPEVTEKLKKIAARTGKTIEQLIEAWADEDLKKNDSVEKAKRNFGKAPKKTLETSRAIPAHVIHAVNLRDQGKCLFKHDNGQRCEAERFIHKHHIVPRALGGKDTVENLISLCSFHHELVHRMEFSFLEQKNWQQELGAMI